MNSELITDFSTDGGWLSHTKMTMKTSLAIVVSELIQGYVHD